MREHAADKWGQGTLLPSSSSTMRLFQSAGLASIAWAMRRMYCPVSADALVLEVGAGGNPYARANVLLDAYESTRERHWEPLSADRPTVLGFVENLPFRDKSFDFVIAAHVLEHSSQPERFLAEIQRVAHAGYIEVPDAFMERINPYRDHRLEITCRSGKLVIRKKKSWLHDPEVVELYEENAKPAITKYLIPRHPFEFHVRYYWKNRIDFTVLNPEVDASWSPPASEVKAFRNYSRLRRGVRDLLRNFSSQRGRNAKIDLVSLMRCTVCHSDKLKREDGSLRCCSCSALFPVRRGMPVMNDLNVGYNE